MVGKIGADATLLERVFGPTLERWGWLSFGGGNLPYEVFGKGFFLVYLLMLPAARTAIDRLVEANANSVARITALLIYRVLWVAVAADFVTYWGMSVPGSVGETLWVTSFMIELLALAALLLSTAIYGIAAARAGYVAWPIGATLTGSVIAVVPTLLFVTAYIPNGVVLPISAAWAILAVWMSMEACSTTGLQTFPPVKAESR